MSIKAAKQAEMDFEIAFFSLKDITSRFRVI